MSQSYCDISSTPRFQNTAADLTPALGEQANKELFRDYLEYGKIRDAEEVLQKLSKAYFSPLVAQVKTEAEPAGANEMALTKAEMFKDLGTSVPKSKISNQQVVNLKQRISRTNNNFAKAGVDKVYTLEVKQVGESDNFTWQVKAFKGKLDVKAKAQRLTENDLEKNAIPTLLSQGTQSTLNFQETQKSYAQEFIRKYADVLKEQVGIDYEFISPEQAKEITSTSENPWSGQKSFFFQGKAFFIEGSLTPDDVLHEFVHPIIRAISKQNRPLFIALHTKLIATPEGQKIVEEVSEHYPNLTMNADDFKEEVLVRAIAKMQDVNSKGLESSATFQKFLDDLLFAIRQFLRKYFGNKITVEHLTPTTTLRELSDILQHGGMFSIDQDVITDNDLVAYKTEFNKYMEGFVAENADAKAMEDLVNKYFTAVKKQMKSLENQGNLGEMMEVMSNKYNTGELQRMAQNLKPYQTLIVQDAKNFESEAEGVRQRVTAVISTMGNTENMVNIIHNNLLTIVKDIDNPENVQKVLYFQKTLNYWGEFANDATMQLEMNGVRNLKMLDNINAAVRRANNQVEEFYNKASKNVLWEKLKHSAQQIDQKWDARIAKLQTEGAPAAEIARAQAEAKSDKLTPEMIDQALRGNLKDLSFAGAFLEGYGYSPDPVVGGLALIVKDQITTIEASAQAKFNESAQILKPLLDRVNYNPNDPGAIGKALGHREKMGYVNPETGEFEEREKWVFLNQFTGAELVRDQYLWKIKKASEKYQESGDAVDKDALAAIQAEWETHRQEYFHSEYSNAFHEAYGILRKDPVGLRARMEMNQLYDEINLLSGQLAVASSDEVIEIADQIEVVRRKIKQMSSLYDIAGNLKVGDELLMAMRLKEFNDAIKDLYVSEEIPKAFQKAYSTYEQKLIDEGKRPGTIMYDDAMTSWLKRNTRVSVKDEFWDKMDLINQAIKDIMSTIPQQAEITKEIDEAYQVIKDLVKGNRDEGGQPIGAELSPEKQEKVRVAQETINKAREKLNRLSGLNKAEQDQINAIFARMSIPGNKISQKETLTLSRLLDKQASLRLNKIQRAELNSLFAELDELRTKEPTESYIDVVNNLLVSTEIHDLLGTIEINVDNACLLLKDDIAQDLMMRSDDYKDWFLRNHTVRETVDWETLSPKKVWDRTYAWSVIKPNESKYYDSTTVQKADGTIEEMPVLPSLKYFKRMVKDEHKTEKIEGVTVDNRGYWLPKTVNQGAKDDRYINKDYARMRTTNPEMFSLLEEVKRFHLKNQQGLDKKGKLWMDMPRFRKQTAERLLSSNPVMRVIQRIKDFWFKVKDGWDQGFNYDDTMNVVTLDLFDDETSGIPMAGISNLDIEEVSTDAIYSTMRYMLATERSKKLKEIAPIARMIQRTVNNQKNYPLESRIIQNNTLVYSDKKKQRYLRAQAVNNYVERIFEGKINVGWGSDNAIAQNMSNMMFRQASRAYLDLNIPSAIKNAMGMKFQGMVEAVAGRYMTPSEFIGAEKWATSTSFEISGQIYEKGPKSLGVQMTELFDADRDRFYHHFGESLTRTPFKDYSFNILHRMTDFRRWTQLQASLQTFAGMMAHQRIQTPEGAITYLDAWTVKDGKIQLKPGVDPTWGITYDEEGNQKIGEKFLQKRNEIHRVIDNLNGAMSREDRPEADRYLLFRYVSFFRRFLTSMLMNRFAYSGSLLKGTSRGRFDYQLGDTKEGFYISVLKLLGNTFRSAGANLPYMKAEEKAATLRLFTEVGTVMLIRYLLMPLLFGWNPDDEDRFKKLRANSDALPLPGVYDDPDREFKLAGWLENHTLLQFMTISGENSMFFPAPGFGLDDYKQMLDVKSMTMGPTIGTAYNIVNDVMYMVTGDDRAYYKRGAGPYDFQQPGSAKIWSHIAKSFGFSGSNVDPVKAIKGYQSIENQ